MHAYEILFSPTGGTAKVAAALTTDWSSVKVVLKHVLDAIVLFSV